MKFLNFHKKGNPNPEANENEDWIVEHEAAVAAMPKNIREAHTHSDDKTEILNSDSCACFYCFARFSSTRVEWTGIDEMVGLCPICGIDAVLGDKCGYDLSDAFLRSMHKYWFDN